MRETPDCRLCGKKEDMQIKNYSVKKNIVWYRCRACNVETKVKLK